MDTTVKKVKSQMSPHGEMGEVCLVSGKTLSMRMWRLDPADGNETARDYETVGYVIDGRAELVLEGQTVLLEPGDSWLVPKQSRHRYRVLETFTAVEATSPPAQVHGRDRPNG